MSGPRALRHHPWLVLILVFAVIVPWAVFTYLRVRPYNLVTFPQGNVATVDPDRVGEGGTVTVTFPEYCNYGQVVTVTRYADIYAPDGWRDATDELSRVTFYPRPGAEPCRAPEVQEVPLGPAFQAYGGRDTIYRIRTVTSYSPNPVRTVSEEASTDPFVVIPDRP